ncbi:MAG TPA: calcium-binding protein, partial [Solirubrobacteraceae bacterium]|nr:calcium-binding protein [Solirubrobacteraceae bacterium]
MRLRVVVLAAALALAAPATASANAVVSTEDAGATVVVDSDALEYNVITVWVAADRVVVRESISGGAITAGPGCDQDSEDEASCPAAGVQRVRVWLGDGDDDFHGGDVGSLRLEVHGEGGNDIVNDGPGDDLLDGGEGWNDVMRPSGGDDEVRGGGGESDLVSYLSYSEGVEVTLPAPGASSTGNGAATEDDTVHGDVEEARGGSGPDSLTGNGGSNALGGGPGEDVVAGGEGADVVNGMSGPDTMDGGPGNDRVFAEDYEADTSIDCGGGDDDLIADNAYDAGSGCEVVAPELDGWPSLATGTFRAGDWIALLMPPVSGTAYSTSAVWRACDAAICAPSSRGDASGYRAADEDVGKRVFARVRVENRAGAAEATTEWTGVIGRRPAAPAPAPPPADPEPP